MLRKVILWLALMGSSVLTYGQANKQLNIGLLGVSLELPVSEEITIAPVAFSDFRLSYLTIGLRGNYYLDDLVGLHEDWDAYAGLNVGYGFWVGSSVYSSSHAVNFGLQIGGRWFWNDRWGVYAELGGARLSGGLLGLGATLKL